MQCINSRVLFRSTKMNIGPHMVYLWQTIGEWHYKERRKDSAAFFLAIEHDLIHFSSASLIIIFMAGRKAKKAKKRPSQRVHHLSLGANWKVAPFWREWGYSFSFYGTHTSQLLWVVMGKVCRRSMCPFTMFYFHSTFLVLQKSEYVLRGKKKFRVIFLW